METTQNENNEPVCEPAAITCTKHQLMNFRELRQRFARDGNNEQANQYQTQTLDTRTQPLHGIAAKNKLYLKKREIAKMKNCRNHGRTRARIYMAEMALQREHKISASQNDSHSGPRTTNKAVLQKLHQIIQLKCKNKQ